MKIYVKEGYFSTLDVEKQYDDYALSKRSHSDTLKLSLMDQFVNYVNKSRSPMSICADGRVIKPSLLKSFVKSFKKSHPDFEIKTDKRHSYDGWDTYIIDPKFFN